VNEIDNWQPLYQELARVIGPEATRQLCRYLGGSQISFPKRLWDQQREATVIWQAYCRGQSVTTLAREHDYSSRTIRRILAKFRE
jgi:Mor family transcriptional regulator